MSSTFAKETLHRTHVGTSAWTYVTGYTPSSITVSRDDGIEFIHFVNSGKGTTKRIAAGTTTVLTTTGITWDSATKAFTLGTDAALCGTNGNKLTIEIYK